MHPNLDFNVYPSWCFYYLTVSNGRHVSPKNIIIEGDLEEELSVDWIVSRKQITIKSYCLSSTIIPLNIHSEFGRKYQAIKIGSNLH